MTEKQLTEAIRETAVRFGADAVGFGGIERFAGENIKEILPETRTVICLLFRVLRGSYRGVEEGTTYYQYTTTGVETLEETVMPMALLRVSALLEDEGYIALPQRKNLQLSPDSHVDPEISADAVRNGVTQEQVMDFDRAAILCGMGERGLSGALLTDAFGPFQRLCFVLTDAELPETPLVTPHLCDRCGECVRACPGHALSDNGKRDDWRCAVYYVGAAAETNPFMGPDAYEGREDREAIMSGEVEITGENARGIIRDTHFYPGVKNSWAPSICGRACDRACYAHLEEKKVLKKEFLAPFRKRAPFYLPPLPPVQQDK